MAELWLHWRMYLFKEIHMKETKDDTTSCQQIFSNSSEKKKKNLWIAVNLLVILRLFHNKTNEK